MSTSYRWRVLGIITTIGAPASGPAAAGTSSAALLGAKSDGAAGLLASLADAPDIEVGGHWRFC